MTLFGEVAKENVLYCWTDLYSFLPSVYTSKVRMNIVFKIITDV